MQPLDDTERLVVNHKDGRYEPFALDGKEEAGQTVLQLDDAMPLGTGFHIYHMAPGAVTTAHEHPTGEHFYVIDGDLQDHDGYEYKAGDLVYLKPGSVHNSTTREGCTLVVFLEAAEDTL